MANTTNQQQAPTMGESLNQNKTYVSGPKEIKASTAIAKG